jgi:hypothetical protein
VLLPVKGRSWPVGPSAPGLVWRQAHPLLTVDGEGAVASRLASLLQAAAGHKQPTRTLAVPEEMVTIWQGWRRLKRATGGEQARKKAREQEKGEERVGLRIELNWVRESTTRSGSRDWRLGGAGDRKASVGRESQWHVRHNTLAVKPRSLSCARQPTGERFRDGSLQRNSDNEDFRGPVQLAPDAPFHMLCVFTARLAWWYTLAGDPAAPRRSLVNPPSHIARVPEARRQKPEARSMQLAAVKNRGWR